jgi:hypothetical protein
VLACNIAESNIFIIHPIYTKPKRDGKRNSKYNGVKRMEIKRILFLFFMHHKQKNKIKTKRSKVQARKTEFVEKCKQIYYIYVDSTFNVDKFHLNNFFSFLMFSFSLPRCQIHILYVYVCVVAVMRNKLPTFKALKMKNNTFSSFEGKCIIQQFFLTRMLIFFC